MYTSLFEVKDFYSGRLGRVSQRFVWRKIAEIWPDTRGERILGLGYSLPYLLSFLDDAEICAALLPPFIGGTFWPHDLKGLTAIADESALPVENDSVDKVIMVHSLEFSDNPHETLSEAWRVLKGNGRLIIIVPNRAGLWTRFDHTPFGHGQPFSKRQIRQLLKDSMFVPEVFSHALYMPPVRSRILLSMFGAWENMGIRFFGAFGGVHVIEASKQLFGGTPVCSEAKKWRGKRVIVPEAAS